VPTIAELTTVTCCLQVFAAPYAFVGSIGVVAEMPNVSKLLQKNNVDWMRECCAVAWFYACLEYCFSRACVCVCVRVCACVCVPRSHI
jgi:hypothetical protein